MTGPEHYKEAERLVILATEQDRTPSREPQPDEWTRSLIARAQVHATLALAAAVAYKPIQDYLGEYDATDGREWSQVISS